MKRVLTVTGQPALKVGRFKPSWFSWVLDLRGFRVFPESRETQGGE